MSKFKLPQIGIFSVLDFVQTHCVCHQMNVFITLMLLFVFTSVEDTKSMGDVWPPSPVSFSSWRPLEAKETWEHR